MRGKAYMYILQQSLINLQIIIWALLIVSTDKVTSYVNVLCSSTQYFIDKKLLIIKLISIKWDQIHILFYMSSPLELP